MGFEERLRRIRGSSGPAVPPVEPEPAAPTGPSLAERLTRLGAGRAAAVPPGPRLPDESALAEALGAVLLCPGVLCLERRIEPRQRHGRVLLGGPQTPADLPWPQGPTVSTAAPPPAPSPLVGEGWGGGVEALAAPGSQSLIRPLPLNPGAPESHPWLCLDTETSGLAGGTGTWAFLTGLLRADGNGWCLRQLLLTRLDAEPAYLEHLAAELSAPAQLLTYNGRSFDAPLLATRFRLAGRPDPLTALPHLDLLGPTRRAFARAWPDCRLTTAESRLLGVVREGDLPGSAAPAAWLGWLRCGQTGPLAAVLRHNRTDLLSLAALLPALDAVYRDPGAHGADCRAVAAAHAERGDRPHALRILTAARRTLDGAGLHDLARLHRQSGDWARALALWEDLAARGDPEARAALARYHEHRGGDLARALELTLTLPPGPDRDRRSRRLAEKLARAAANPPLGDLGAA